MRQVSYKIFFGVWAIEQAKTFGKQAFSQSYENTQNKKTCALKIRVINMDITRLENEWRIALFVVIDSSIQVSQYLIS